MKYQELGYTLPSITAEAAANKAISILEEISKTDDSCLFYVMQASNILALAGLRAESPYNEFEPNFDVSKQIFLNGILNKHGCAILYDKIPYYENERNFFSVVCSLAYKNLPKQYDILKSFWKEPLDLGDPIDFILWCDYIERSFANLMSSEKLPKEWLLYWWNPSDLRFGMVLGYPGPAISSLCWMSTLETKGKEVEPQLLGNFPFQGQYCGTHIDYDYSSELRDDPTMKEHETLWSDVLNRVYEAFPESRTIKLPGFMGEFERYKKYNE